jgi:hypothetical protein
VSLVVMADFTKMIEIVTRNDDPEDLLTMLRIIQKSIEADLQAIDAKNQAIKIIKAKLGG